MKLSEFVGDLQQLMIDNPANAELSVVFSTDDEGNEFRKIHFAPSLGTYDEHSGDFYTDEEMEKQEINAVCVN